MDSKIATRIQDRLPAACQQDTPPDTLRDGRHVCFRAQLTGRPHVATAVITGSCGDSAGTRTPQAAAFQRGNLALPSELFWFVFSWRESTLFQISLADIFILLQAQIIRIYMRCNQTVSFVPGEGPAAGQTGLPLPWES